MRIEPILDSDIYPSSRIIVAIEMSGNYASRIRADSDLKILGKVVGYQGEVDWSKVAPGTTLKLRYPNSAPVQGILVGGDPTDSDFVVVYIGSSGPFKHLKRHAVPMQVGTAK